VVREPSAHDAAEERQLVRAAADGSLQAWCTLVARHAPAVWAWAVDWTDDDAVAAQVSEVVWLRLAQSLLELQGTPVADWLYRQVADQAGRQCSGEFGRNSTRRGTLPE
jgi:DNA-directed RNA polymerase specialized sigma24 family protein